MLVSRQASLSWYFSLIFWRGSTCSSLSYSRMDNLLWIYFDFLLLKDIVQGLVVLQQPHWTDGPLKSTCSEHSDECGLRFAQCSCSWLHQLFWIELWKSTALLKQPAPVYSPLCQPQDFIDANLWQLFPCLAISATGYKLLSSSLEPLGVIHSFGVWWCCTFKKMPHVCWSVRLRPYLWCLETQVWEVISFVWEDILLLDNLMIILVKSCFTSPA